MIPKRLSLILSGLLVILLVSLVLAAVSVHDFIADTAEIGNVADRAAIAATGNAVTTGDSSKDNIKSSHLTPKLSMIVNSTYPLYSSSPFRPTSEVPESPEGEAAESSSEGCLGSLKEGAAVAGWPLSLEVEIDELEIGGMAIPIVQALTQNYKIGTVNFGNVDAVSPGESGSDASVGVGGETGQSGFVPGPGPVAT
ncbi:hypothetical protein EC991_002040 [Linnemannia zychae]|nr:hypothetical protein EC991_002040 [Linnemannia zychae]